MHIRIDDNFDDKTELEYKSVDDEVIVGNGVLGNNYKIIEVENFSATDEELKDSVDDNKFDVIIEGASFFEEDLKGSNRNNKVNNKVSKSEDKKINGKIIVISRLASKTGAVISSARINLYALNGISPKLVYSKLSDENGVVIFDNLQKGSYRVIAIVDRKYFEKPTYVTWNEVTINEELREETITVINKIKSVSK